MKMLLEERLDSNNNNEEVQVPEIGFFEGTEKLLEVWFHQGDIDESYDSSSNIKRDLRIIPRYVRFCMLLSNICSNSPQKT